jgi:F420-non-reducing hydrogenase iron-sulfur subunit
MMVIRYMLDLSGIGQDRLCLRWVSASEGRLFAEYVAQFSQRTRDLGPFDPGRFEKQLEAIETALASPRLRWLMGMDLHLTRRGNVFQEKIPQGDYHRLLETAAEEEYQGAVMLNLLKDGPLSVRQIALRSGLPVYTVSLRLGELERRHQARLSSYEGTTPRFIGSEFRETGPKSLKGDTRSVVT